MSNTHDHYVRIIINNLKGIIITLLIRLHLSPHIFVIISPNLMNSFKNVYNSELTNFKAPKIKNIGRKVAK